MNFSLTSLGTASALPTVARYPSAHTLSVHGRLFLIDCGEACQIQLRRYGFSFAKIDDIFISHLHGDHLFGIFGLLSTMAMTGRVSELRIYAPKGFEKVLKFFLEQFGEGVKYNINYKELSSTSPEVIFSSRTIEALAFPLNHRIATYGFLFREKEPQKNVYKEKIEEHNLTLRDWFS